MRIELTKDWCMRMAQLEAEVDGEIGAGLLAIDPVFESKAASVEPSEETTIAFSRFVRLARRGRGLSVEKLAENADVEVVELVSIEENGQYKPDLRTVYQLANFFGVQRANLLQVAGLTAPKDSHIVSEAVRFAARSEPVAALTAEERSALEAFVSVLSEQK
jgi:HTH-type transcriptional regulator, competence development regulator